MMIDHMFIRNTKINNKNNLSRKRVARRESYYSEHGKNKKSKKVIVSSGSSRSCIKIKTMTKSELDSRQVSAKN